MIMIRALQGSDRAGSCSTSSFLLTESSMRFAHKVKNRQSPIATGQLCPVTSDCAAKFKALKTPLTTESCREVGFSVHVQASLMPLTWRSPKRERPCLQECSHAEHFTAVWGWGAQSWHLRLPDFGASCCSLQQCQTDIHEPACCQLHSFTQHMLAAHC